MNELIASIMRTSSIFDAMDANRLEFSGDLEQLENESMLTWDMDEKEQEEINSNDELARL